MGYRHKLGILEKEKHHIIKDMTVKQLKEWYGDEEYVPCYEITKEVYELGKYYDDRFIAPFRSDVFSKEGTNKYFQSENDFYILSKEGFLAIIEDIRKKVLNYYESILKPLDKDDPYAMVVSPEQAIKAKIAIWGENCTKYKLYPYQIEGEQ